MYRKFTVKDVARLMGKNEMFVRIGLQRGLLTFGLAIKTSSKYSYYINPSQLEEYLGIKLDEEICTSFPKNNKMV
jgi:hypothetical protein